jgi:hypothetical protein
MLQSAFDGASRELDRYGSYSINWDGYRAMPFDPALLERIRGLLQYAYLRFLESSLAPDLVTTGPASDGSIDLEIVASGRRLMLTAYADEDAIQAVGTETNAHNAKPQDLGTGNLDEWLRWLDCTLDRGAQVDRSFKDPVRGSAVASCS